MGSGATAKQIGGSSVVLSGDTIRTTLGVNQSLLGSSAADDETFGLIEGVSNGSALAANFRISLNTSLNGYGKMGVSICRNNAPAAGNTSPPDWLLDDPSYLRCLGGFKCKSTRISDL